LEHILGEELGERNLLFEDVNSWERP